MKIGKIDKVELSGLIVLFIGAILLVFTFFSAYAFLAGRLNIAGSQNLIGVFGEALAPLIEAVIRILYLGIMGWVGSILTIRAIQLLKKERTETAPLPQQHIKTENKQTTKQEPRPEAKEEKTTPEKPTQVKEPEKIETPENPQQVEKTEEPASPSTPTPLPPAPAS